MSFPFPLGHPSKVIVERDLNFNSLHHLRQIDLQRLDFKMLYYLSQPKLVNLNFEILDYLCEIYFRHR